MSNPQPVEANVANITSLTKRARLLGRLPWVRSADDPIPNGESYLCDVCENIDLRIESFIVSEGDNEHARVNKVKYLGPLQRIRSKAYCPFCRLVIGIADRPPDQRAPSHVAEANPTCYARWVIDGQEDLGQDPDKPGEHIFRPRTRRLLIYSEPQAFKDGYLVLLRDDAPSPWFFGRRVSSPDLLDAALIKSWLSDCETLHGPECDESLVHPDLLNERNHVFRAVDVEQMCITEPPEDCRYIALSYLWGRNFSQLFTTSKNLPKLSMPGALLKERLPRTIKDSIKLTRLLGEKYLWTDSLALLHDDGFQYHDDWIYSRAALTLVAGSGKDANAGLPGVRKESRTFHQEIEEVKPGLRLMVSHLAEDYISTSQWDSRAWTFQERMLSRRCLLFVNGRIYYQCRRTTFCEDIEMPRTNGWSLDSIDMPTRIFREKPFVQFTSAVELYTRRELTNPNDILNAFEGVQLVLEKRIGSPIFYGALETMMDSSLLWESSKRLIRRPGFPTWSWSGWLGEIQWKFTEEAQSWIEWHKDGDRKGRKFPIQGVPRLSTPIPRQAPQKVYKVNPTGHFASVLHFETISAAFKLASPTHLHKAVISPLRKRLTGPSALSTVRPAPTDPRLIRAGISDAAGIWCGTIDLDECWLSRMGRPLEFLIMSKVDGFTQDEISTWEGILPDDIEEILSRPGYGVYNVLLVSRRGDVYFREGLGRILKEGLERALAPGPFWKDIILG